MLIGLIGHVTVEIEKEELAKEIREKPEVFRESMKVLVHQYLP